MRKKQYDGESQTIRQGFTQLELMMVISIIGVLLSLVLPAVQSSRESARQMQCKIRMRQIGNALHNFESSHQILPAGNNFANNSRHSWCTIVLPFLDQSPLFNRYDWTKSWNDAGSTGQTNHNVTQTRLSIFRCPSEPEDHRMGGTDYGGNFGTSQTGLVAGFNEGDGWEAGALLVINSPVLHPKTRAAKFGEFSDGLSHTFMVYECSGRTTEAGYWGSGTNCLAIEYAINANLDGETIKSRHPGGGHALFSDGHISFFSNSADLNVVSRMATRSGGEIVD